MTNLNEDERLLRELIEGWARAVREGDLNRVVEPHTGDIVLFDVAAPVQHRGLAAYREAFAPFLDGGPHQLFELGELRLTIGSNVAFAHALLRIEKEQDFAVRLTLAFVKEQGRWSIAHEHHSATV